MTVQVVNAQREAPVDARRMARVATRAARRLGIRVKGLITVAFIDSQRMRLLNKRFLKHDYFTDVLSFRYDGGPRGKSGVPPYSEFCRPGEIPIGEILIAPSQARAYARMHGIPYEEELARYVIHGLLHWLGHNDQTPAQQRAMRAREDRLLTCCRLGP